MHYLKLSFAVSLCLVMLAVLHLAASAMGMDQTGLAPTPASKITTAVTSTNQYGKTNFEFTCFDNDDDSEQTQMLLKQIPIGLQVSHNPLHQILTRIFAILIREKLNYQNITLVPINYKYQDNDNYEIRKLQYILNTIEEHPEYPELNMINLAVWMPAMGHFLLSDSVIEASYSTPPGRFGLFMPDNNYQNDTLLGVSYEMFKNMSNEYYQNFVIDDSILNQLQPSSQNIEVSEQCINRSCVTILAEYREDTSFIKYDIASMGVYMNVMWLGSEFRKKIHWLYDEYNHNERYRNRVFIILHWMPSIVINGRLQFRQITLPKCEDYPSMQGALCKYEYTPLLKYYTRDLSKRRGNSHLLFALRQFLFQNISNISIELSDYEDRSIPLTESVYNQLACKWLKENKKITKYWILKEPLIKIAIGGIFPISDPSRGHQNLQNIVQQAVDAVNRSQTILSQYELVLYKNDGKCLADTVMKSFIHYFNDQNVLGVLGPACSDTVEPIAGISKHLNMAVISYSAEGASFLDRNAYPYFFRTIGSNRQYEDVYISLMKKMNWKRVAALTEDGQKYTEYISHLETTLKQQNLQLIMNKKFLSDVTPNQMNKHLVDLKDRHAKIIIADIQTKYAEMAMCEASKLHMTAYDGYVWFFPSWISNRRNSIGMRSNISCTEEELQKAFEGYFTIMHTPFGDNNSTMQENISIEEWKNNTRAEGNGSISNYAGFAYDAVWAYALAADKLFKENVDAVHTLHTKAVVQRFVELIWETNFQGVSGHVRFGQGGSRITSLDIMQWQQTKFVTLGKFYPEVISANSSLRTNGGRLILDTHAINWLLGAHPPGDGTYDCIFSGMAELLGTNCDGAMVIITAICCFLVVIVISLISFLFWKKRYDNKLKQSAKIMKNFGIDLLSPSRSKENTLDKWEIPKENVVINRRLGEGAFGTVYGGEAQLASDGWAAVAVKTLKVGASTEDRLDFLTEAEAMKRLDHKNIIKLLGVCLQTEPIYTIMEFMLYGDLKTYLLARRHLVTDKLTDESDISPKRLTMYAMDISRGLAYLSEQKYVHRDIACRNCLVNAERVVKLADFGMARATFESDYYRFNRKGMLPVRWMAPESLGLGVFTPASDVWAFGVVLYEIITFGSFPYQGLTNNQAMEYIKSGKTLQIPIGVKPHLEGLLKACWSQEPKKRPLASDIVDYMLNNPRLLTPCLDLPGSAVQMPETESDELELLPRVRRTSPNRRDSTLDILAPTSGILACNESSDSNEEQLTTPPPINIELSPITLNEISAICIDTFSPITPDGYSVMSPLLMHQGNGTTNPT